MNDAQQAFLVATRATGAVRRFAVRRANALTTQFERDIFKVPDYVDERDGCYVEDTRA